MGSTKKHEAFGIFDKIMILLCLSLWKKNVPLKIVAISLLLVIVGLVPTEIKTQIFIQDQGLGQVLVLIF